MVLEGDGEVLVVLFLTEVQFHAGVHVAVVGAVFLHVVGDELERLTHAVLGHFLLSLVQLLELLRQDREGVPQDGHRGGVQRVRVQVLHRQRAVLHQELDDLSACPANYWMLG